MFYPMFADTIQRCITGPTETKMVKVSLYCGYGDKSKVDLKKKKILLNPSLTVTVGLYLYEFNIPPTVTIVYGTGPQETKARDRRKAHEKYVENKAT